MLLPFKVNIPVLLEGIPHPAMMLDEAYRIITMNRLMEAMTLEWVRRRQDKVGTVAYRYGTEVPFHAQ